MLSLLLYYSKSLISILLLIHIALYFLETLDFYAVKYGRKEICHYYLSEESDEECTFEEVTHTPEKIYKQLVDPSLLLAREKRKWEDEHEPV